MPAGGVSPKKPGTGDGIEVMTNISSRVGRVVGGTGSVACANEKGVGVDVTDETGATIGGAGGEAGRLRTT